MKPGPYLSGLKIVRLAERKKLLATLIEAAGPINLKVMACEDVNSVTAAIVDLVRDKDPEWGHKKSVVAWQHPLDRKPEPAGGPVSNRMWMYFLPTRKNLKAKTYADTSLIPISVSPRPISAWRTPLLWL